MNIIVNGQHAYNPEINFLIAKLRLIDETDPLILRPEEMVSGKKNEWLTGMVFCLFLG